MYWSGNGKTNDSTDTTISIEPNSIDGVGRQKVTVGDPKFGKILLSAFKYAIPLSSK
jgi:hypothetical protein